MKKQNTVFRVGRFPQLTRQVFTTEQGLKSNIASALCFDCKGTLYVGTDKGLSKLDGDKFVSVELPGKEQAVSMLYCDGDNTLYAGVGKRLIAFNGKKKISTETFTAKIVDMKVDADGVKWVLTEDILYRYPRGEKDFDLKIGVPGKGSCLSALKDNKVYVGTAGEGLHALTGKRWHWSELMADMTGLLSNSISCVDIDSAGNIWAGTDRGMCVYDDKSYWLTPETVDGLPDAPITGMAVCENGDRYFATVTGLIHQHNGILTYYGYKRWLPSPHATGVAVSPDGKVCVSTDAGISVFTTEMMTLEEKADHYFRMAETYNVRKDGFVLERNLEHEGVVSLDEGNVRTSDNDGLWTGLYLAGLCFQYACTKREDVLKAAKRSLRAMIKLTEITGKDGFTARAIRYADEIGYGTGVRHEWHKTTDRDGNELEWLGETSSDEMVGHFYAYSLFYDLVADEEEKELIRGVVAKILNHILDNKLKLVDVDGLPTTWANWDPDLLNDDHKWVYEKGTNSIEILAFLKIGEHMTGDRRYREAFDYLVSEKHYAMNLMQYKIPDGHVMHIDDNLCFLMIYPLMKYTDDPELRSMFAMGLTHHWKDERVERNQMFNVIYGAVTGEKCDIDKTVEELMDFPMDLVAWTIYNSHRSDLKWDMAPVEMDLVPQLFEPLEAHERRISSESSNRFIADSGAEDVASDIFKKKKGAEARPMLPGTGNDKGMSLSTGKEFMHPYWMARYHGLIEDMG